MLTELVGDVVGDVHLAIAPLSPHTARGGAGVGVSVSTWLDGDVSSDQGGLIQVRDCSEVSLRCIIFSPLITLD